MDTSPIPPALKPVSPYIKLAKEYDKRDPVVSYFCRLYSVQKGISTDSKSPDCKTFLFALMDKLETEKKSLAAEGHEAVGNEIVGQAHLESMALNLFSWADKEDRKSNFNKGLVKAFYSANLLFDVLKQFGEIGDEITFRQRYAKWKATYIHKCLQTGETPVPGPQGSEFEGAEFHMESSEQNDQQSAAQTPSSHETQLPYPTATNIPPYPSPGQPGPSYYQQPKSDYPPPQQQIPAPSYTESLDDHSSSAASSSSTNASTLSADDYQQATKHCKYAISAMQYEDINTAIDNLTKALNLLKRGK